MRKLNTLTTHVVFLTSFLLISLSCDGRSSEGKGREDASSKPFKPASWNQFEVFVEGEVPEGCNAGAREPSGNLLPPYEELKTLLGEASAEFIVLVKHEIDQEAFPMPVRADRGGAGWQRDAVYTARASEIAASQRCAIAAVRVVGGTYDHSFLLINAFTAQLRAEQADEVARHPDVRAVELSQSETGPGDTPR